ncbi:DNA helicase [Tanacetum coccineum]
MAETTKTPPKAAEKGKMILFQHEVINLRDIRPTHPNKIIEVRIYQKWIARNVRTKDPSNFCCILLDKEGNAIQTNMDLKDTEYFDQLLQLNNAYKISRFWCTETKKWQRTLDNKTILNFGRYTSFDTIANDPFPEHYFNFIAYNEVQSKADVSGATLTDYIGCIHQISDPIITGDATRGRTTRRIIDIQNLEYCFRIIIHDGTGATTLACFSPEAHTFVPDCNEVVNAVENKDTRHIPVALKKFENATYIFQYHFGKGATAGNPDFTLDAAFKPSSQPLLGLPAPESATSPPQEIMEETSSAMTPRGEARILN